MARRRYWLLKCEPGAYDIDDLARDGVTSWEGVRNFQARNLLRDEVAVGDGVLFYASNAEPSGVSGIAEVARAGYPDPFAVKKGHRYFDPNSDPDQPTWYAVDIRFVERFPQLVTLATLKATPGLESMEVTRKGSRLSVQPVTASEFEIVCELGRGGGAAGVGEPAPATPAKASVPAAAASEVPRPAEPRRAAARPVAKKPARGKTPAPAKPAPARQAPAKPAPTRQTPAKPAPTRPTAAKRAPAQPPRAGRPGVTKPVPARPAAGKQAAAKSASTKPAEAGSPAAPAKPRGGAGGGSARRPGGRARRGAA
jgi:predicted RNA-binding protein with PUA-like domain